jgi:hypothetical protein
MLNRGLVSNGSFARLTKYGTVLTFDLFLLLIAIISSSSFLSETLVLVNLVFF